MKFKGIEICCPVCKGELQETADCGRETEDRQSVSGRQSSVCGLLCSSCDRRFPVLLGIPDLRIFPDPYIGFDADRAKGTQVAARFEELSFSELVDFYYSITSVVPAKDARQYKRGLMAGVARTEAALSSWEHTLNGRSHFRSGIVLEVGCGTAPLLVSAKSRYQKIVGVDIAFRWLAVAKKRLAEAKLDVPLICACAEALPFPNAAFDRVVADSVLEHLGDQHKGLNEIYRVMRPGGYLFVATPNKYSLGPDPHAGIWAGGYLPARWVAAYVRRNGGIPPKRRLLSAQALYRLIREAGFHPPQIQLPDVSMGQRRQFGNGMRVLIDLYHLAKRWPASRSLLQMIGPLLHAVAAKPDEPLPKCNNGTKMTIGVSVREFISALFIIASFVSLSLSSIACQPSAAGLTLTLQPTQTFQTFHAWRGSLKQGPFWVDHSVSPPVPKMVSSSLLNRVLDDLVFDLGLTGVRVGLPEAVEPTNDNADPFSIDWSGFHFERSWLGGSRKERRNDPVAQMREIILPLKRRVESKGVPFSSYVSLGPQKSEIARHWNNPEEYAEVAEAFLTYLKTNFDFEPTFWVIYNEPDLAGFSTQEVVANIAALGPRLKQKGFNTKIQFPETETPGKAMPWVNAVLSDHRVTQYLGMISFHSYDYNWQEAPASFAPRNALREQAKKLGVMTGSTETCCRYGGSSRSSYQFGLENSRDMYFNLTEADAAVWEPFSIMESCSTPGCPGGGLFIGFENDLSTYYKQAHYYANRQYMSFIRPGYTRVGISCSGCSSTSAGQNVKPVAFRSPAGSYVAVVINDQTISQVIQLDGFPAGNYQITGVDPANTAGRTYPAQTIAAGQPLLLNFPAQGIVTFAQTTSGSSTTSHRAQPELEPASK